MNPAPLIVLDTNVLITALLNPFGAPGRIWDLVLAREIQLAYDDRVLIEYERVLNRAKFGFEKSRVDAHLAIFLFQQAVITKPWPQQTLPDPDDAIFLEVAFAASAPLITGNTRHFPDQVCGTVRVIKPHEWLENRYRD
jgi:putative PIN family toxin of toxin-antitoxin system